MIDPPRDRKLVLLCPPFYGSACRNIRCPAHVLESSNIRRAIAPCLLLTVSEPLLFIHEPFEYMDGQDPDQDGTPGALGKGNFKACMGPCSTCCSWQFGERDMQIEREGRDAVSYMFKSQ